MSDPQILNQAMSPLPPRRGQGFALTVDGTVRVYDISTLAWGGVTFDQTARDKGLFLTLHAQGGDIFFRFQSGTDTDMNSATVISAGGTITLQASFCQRLAQDGYADIKIERVEDKYLSVSGSGTLRVSLSSQPPR